MPLGAQMSLGGFFLLSARSTATTGVRLSRTITASACLRSTMAIMAPSGGPLKTAGLQGKT
jgi:hypothetical protein